MTVARKTMNIPKKKRMVTNFPCNWFASVRISVKHKGQTTYLKKKNVYESKISLDIFKTSENQGKGCSPKDCGPLG